MAPQQMVLKRVPRSRADRGICRGGAARVRAKCCRLGYVGDGRCGRTTGYKGECAIEMSKSREQNHTSKIRFQNHRILRLRASRALRKAPLRQRKVAAARTARAALPAPRLRKKQASAPQTRPDATSDPHRIALGPSAARAAKQSPRVAHRVLHRAHCCATQHGAPRRRTTGRRSSDTNSARKVPRPQHHA